MKLKTTILVFALFLFCKAFSQTSGGPDAFGYTWKNSYDVAGPMYSWIDVPPLSGAIQVTGLADDNTVGPFLLPSGMNFHYYWYDINKFWVGSNGYVLFMNGEGFGYLPVLLLVFSLFSARYFFMSREEEASKLDTWSKA